MRQPAAPTVASAFWHEVAEGLGDPTCGGYWMMSNGSRLVAQEICDPVQDGIVLVTLQDGTQVGLSDWILPAWNDAQNTTGPFNYLKTLTEPFSMSAGGYMVVIDLTTGQSSQVFGEEFVFGDEMPVWMREMKERSHRNRRRIHRHRRAANHHRNSSLQTAGSIVIDPFLLNQIFA